MDNKLTHAPEPVDGELVQKMVNAFLDAKVRAIEAHQQPLYPSIEAALAIARPVIEAEQRQKDVLEMLRPFADAEWPQWWTYAGSDLRCEVNEMFANRRARYAPKPKTDPAVEAVAEQLRLLGLRRKDMPTLARDIEQIVAAVRKADEKGGQL